MRTSGQIYQKLKQVRFRHVKKEVESLLKRSPNNCENHALLDSQFPLGFCKLDLQVCDASRDRSGTCGKFAQAHGREDVKKSLHDFFSGRSVAEIAARFPDVAALLWVLDGELPEEGSLPAGSEGSLPAGSEEYFPGSVLVGTPYQMKLWADSEDEAQKLRLFFDRARDLEQRYSELNLQVEDLRNKEALSKDENELLQKALEKRSQEISRLERTLATAESLISELRKSLDFQVVRADRLEGDLRKVQELTTLPKPQERGLFSFLGRVFR